MKKLWVLALLAVSSVAAFAQVALIGTTVNNVVYSSSYSSLNAAVAGCPLGGGCTVVISAPTSLSASLTTATTTTLQFYQPGALTTTGFTLTANGPVIAAAYRIFAGSGTVTLGIATNKPAVEWFGAVGDWNGTTGTDNTAAIQACLNALANGQCALQAQSYKTSAPLSITRSNVGIAGVSLGIPNSALYPTPSASEIIITNATADILDVSGTSTSANITYNKFTNFTLARNQAPGTSAAGLRLSFSYGATIDGVTSQDSTAGFLFHGVGSQGTGYVQNSAATWGYNGFAETSGSLAGFEIDSSSGVASPSLRIRNSFAVANTTLSGTTTIGLESNGSALNDLMVDHFETATVNYGVFLQAATTSVPSTDIHKVFEDIFAKETIKLQELRQSVLAEDPEALVTLIELANKRHWLPAGLRREFKALAQPDAKVVLIELRFPDYSNHKFVVGQLKNGKDKYASATENKKILRGTLYSVVIRAGYIASCALEGTSYHTVAVNVVQDWFDRATGAARSGVICSLQAQAQEFTGLNLREVDPEACFRHLKGISVPSLETLSPIRPIFVLNKKDERFVEAKDLSEFLETEENLAAMPWDDFEHLVAQLFEWEFAKEGVEVRVTRVSRDRGVDAVLFDPDPLRGGKFVLQAKRYTKPVDVSAVRDLYGTVMNEGANRGILITTSSYGPDAYEFAKNKPLSLVDGPNLLLMLQRHGKKFRLDLAEARRLLQEVD
jgi:Restriction endonuclease